MAARSRASNSGCRPRLVRPPGAASAAYRPPLDWCLAGSSRPAGPSRRHRPCQWRAYHCSAIRSARTGVPTGWGTRSASARLLRASGATSAPDYGEESGLRPARLEHHRYPHHPLRLNQTVTGGRWAIVDGDGNRLANSARCRASARQPAPDELAPWRSSRDKQHETGCRVRADADPRHSLILTRGRDRNRVMIWTDMTNHWVGSCG